jgi:hypothetical protein
MPPNSSSIFSLPLSIQCYIASITATALKNNIKKNNLLVNWEETEVS